MYCAVMNLQARHVHLLEITIYKEDICMIIKHYIAGADDVIAWSLPLRIVNNIQETNMAVNPNMIRRSLQ